MSPNCYAAAPWPHTYAFIALLFCPVQELVSTGRTSARGQGRAIDNSRVSKEKEDWRATGSSGADLCTRRTRKMSGEDIVNGVSAGRRAALVKTVF